VQQIGDSLADLGGGFPITIQDLAELVSSIPRSFTSGFGG
jgi:hypothetical protein